jgi:putative transposase
MTNIRRYFHPNSLCFLTHVTLNRCPILVQNIDLLQTAIKDIRAKSPFDPIAWVVLPDHFHVLINSQQQNVSLLMRRIKLSFSQRYRARMELFAGRVWQYRFWDRMIRDEAEMEKYIHYIHFNPVKHGLVSTPSQYPHSSYNWFVRNGYYQEELVEEPESNEEVGFGE